MTSSETQTYLFDLSRRDEIVLTGKDRQSFLHGFCSNDIKRLQPGDGCEAFVTSIQGKTLGHIFVFATADSLVLDTEEQTAEPLIAHLDRYLITEDVTLSCTTASRQLFLLTGPDSSSIADSLIPGAGSLEPNRFMSVESGIEIRRVSWFTESGFQIRIGTEAVSQWKQFRQTHSLQISDPGVYEQFRIRQGFPRYGIDFNADRLAQEIDRTSQAISFHKGCYLGQEPIARIDALGHVNWLIRRLRISGVENPSAGDFVGRKVLSEQKEVGTITSVAQDLGSSELFAIALVRREAAEQGTILRFSDPEIPANVQVIVDTLKT